MMQTPVGRTAVRTDAATRVREEATFLPAGDTELFSVLYRPPVQPRGGIVMCGSIFAEQLRTYRAEVLAARAFAARGFAVMRFHYRGTGHSGGLTEEATVATMTADATQMAASLRERTGIDRPLFWGIRWGGLIAGLVAGDQAGAPLILWEPVADGVRFFRELFRAQQMSVLAGGDAGPAASTAQEVLGRSGWVDVLGYHVYRALYESGSAIRLLDLTVPPRSVLLVQVARRQDLKPEFATLRDTWTAAGSTVQAELVERDEAWWFIGSPMQSTDALIEITESWLARGVGGPHR